MSYVSKDEIIQKLTEDLLAANEKIRLLEAKVAAFENPDEDFKMDFGTELKSVPSTSPEEDELPTLDMSSKPEMGVSYGSAALRSTLAYIDIEEMCFCIAKVIRLSIEHYKEQADLEAQATMEQPVFQRKGSKKMSLLPDYFGEEKMIDKIKKIHENRMSNSQEYMLQNRNSIEFDDFNSSLKR